jgi:hypothetical protein
VESAGTSPLGNAVLTSDLFEAYLACPTKCFLKRTGVAASENSYAAWVEQRDDGETFA